MLGFLIGTAGVVQLDREITHLAIQSSEKDAAAIVASLTWNVLPPAVIVLGRGSVDAAAAVVEELDDDDALFKHGPCDGCKPLFYAGMTRAREFEPM